VGPGGKAQIRSRAETGGPVRAKRLSRIMQRDKVTYIAKMFLGFTKYYSVTNILTRLPSFDTLMINARKSDAARWSASSNALVKSLLVV